MKKVKTLGLGLLGFCLLVGCGTANVTPLTVTNQTSLHSSAVSDQTADAFLQQARNFAYSDRRDPASQAFRKAADLSGTGGMAMKIANAALEMKYYDRDAQYALDRAVTLKAAWTDILNFAQNAVWYDRRELASNGFRRAADRCEKAQDALKVADVAQGFRFYTRDAQYAMDKAATLP